MSIDVADRLAELMKKKALSQYRLQQLSGVSQSAISSILLKNKKPRVETMRKLLNAMNVSESDFYQNEIMNSSEEENKLKNLKKFVSMANKMYPVPGMKDVKLGSKSAADLLGYVLKKEYTVEEVQFVLDFLTMMKQHTDESK